MALEVLRCIFLNKNLENIEPRIKKIVFKNNNKKKIRRDGSIFPSGFEPGPLSNWCCQSFQPKNRSNLDIIEGI